jgi:thymidylate synthase
MKISSETTIEAWKSGLSYILKKGKDFVDENKRTCREVLNFVIEVEYPEKNITKPVESLYRFKKWVYPSIEELAEVIMSRKTVHTYAFSYGPRLFNFKGKINQIDDFLIPLFKKDNFSRRGIVTIWDPEEDSKVHKREIPALISIDFKMRNKKLNATAVVRSNDLFFGWPANIYQIFVLQEYIAKKLGCKIGSLTTFSNSAHIFKDQFEDIRKIVGEQ